MTTQSDLDKAAAELAKLLRERDQRIVFAESCTGGLVAATLTRVPGISERLCGSAVVYQIATKHEWLGISDDLLNDPGPVSPEVAEAMATGVLNETPHATLAVSVTGHLGPNAPSNQDGLVYIAAAGPRSESGSFDIQCEEIRLARETPTADPVELRLDRQRDVAVRVLRFATSSIQRR